MNRTSVTQNYCIDLVYSNPLVGGSDYREIIAINLDVHLMFSDMNLQESFPVDIIDDSAFELDVEDFTLELRFDPSAPKPPSNVILCPNTTTVDVIDDEGIVVLCITTNTIILKVLYYNTMTALLGVAIGFLNTSYTVNKDDGLVNIQVGIINEGIMLGISVEVRFFFISQNQSLTDGV